MTSNQPPLESRYLSAVITREGDWFIAGCLEIDVASQGESKSAALDNLREARELHLEDPVPAEVPQITPIEVQTSTA